MRTFCKLFGPPDDQHLVMLTHCVMALGPQVSIFFRLDDSPLGVAETTFQFPGNASGQLMARFKFDLLDTAKVAEIVAETRAAYLEAERESKQ